MNFLLIIKANQTNKICDLRNYLKRARPEYTSRIYSLMTSFPNKEIADLKEANLLNASRKKNHVRKILNNLILIKFEEKLILLKQDRNVKLKNRFKGTMHNSFNINYYGLNISFQFFLNLLIFLIFFYIKFIILLKNVLASKKRPDILTENPKVQSNQKKISNLDR
ncbi:NSFL1 cofactor p47 isoform X1 [Brachionus plicatilis]|uniref:NSFL1 cofactor p47 isoform X1 n=1 Tax=Brachionus plicatilis TaxID=10195 RepID=A0A3M7PGC9_BRAPC|nr:NSFL1 cofactor p47 isoform X1 [Brachionus plicatilis]